MRTSVVIPVYNTERYVAAAIDSVLAQITAQDEIIVVDDGSTDGTAAVLDQFATRVVVIRQEHAGPCTALNTGIARASREFLAFNDADDLWAPRKLERQHAALDNDPDLEAVFGMAVPFDSPDWRADDPARTAPEPIMPGIHRAAMLIRHSAFDRIGPFDPTLRVADFIDWYGRAQQQGLRALTLPDVVLHRRIHATNTGRLRRQPQRTENLMVLKRLLDARRRSATPSASDESSQSDR